MRTCWRHRKTNTNAVHFMSRLKCRTRAGVGWTVLNIFRLCHPSVSAWWLLCPWAQHTYWESILGILVEWLMYKCIYIYNIWIFILFSKQWNITFMICMMIMLKRQNEHDYLIARLHDALPWGGRSSSPFSAAETSTSGAMNVFASSWHPTDYKFLWI